MPGQQFSDSSLPLNLNQATTQQSEIISLQSESDIVNVRQAVRRIGTELRFTITELTKMITAASEIARNTVIYGGGGIVRLEVLQIESKKGLKLTFVDEGPGIPDLELAMRDGYTTGNGLGLGLSGAKRLVNEFEIDSRPGKGTTISLIRWK